MNTQQGILKTTLTICISILFAVFFMWLALENLDFNKIQSSLSHANYFWVFASIVFSTLAYGFRAIRWNLLLNPMGYHIKNSNAFWTIAFGYMMNLTIPRSGEIARATALFSVEKVPVEKSFATVVIERVVDFCFMLLFLLLTFIFKAKVLFFFNRMKNYQSTEQKKTSTIELFLINNGIENLENFYFGLKILLGAIILGGFALLFLKFRQKLFSFTSGILEGLLSILKMQERLKFLYYSTGIWSCYFFSAYLFCLALEETSFFSIGDVFLIITAGSLGMMVPTAGGAGSFHIAIKLAIAGVFVAMGKSQTEGEEIGLTYAILSHSVQVICVLVLGIISILILMKRRK